MHEEAEEGK